MQKLNQSYIKSVVNKALEEDLKPRGDITTNLIASKNKIIKAQIIAKQDGIIAGLEFCKTAFHVDRYDSHMVGLYSVNTNNGYTLFEDGTKVESVENQMVIFDGKRKHCSVAQTDTKLRINININFR